MSAARNACMTVAVGYLIVGAIIVGEYGGDLATKCPGTIHPIPAEQVIGIFTWLPYTIGYAITYKGPKWDSSPCP